MSATSLTYTLNQLPGEAYIREWMDQSRLYRDWRMNRGILMEDVDHVIGASPETGSDVLLTLEYEWLNGDIKNYAILEMKHWRYPTSKIKQICEGKTASKQLANDAGYPFFVIRYYPAQENNGVWEFSVYRGNDRAKELVSSDLHLSEKSFLIFLYRLRHKTLSDQLLHVASKTRYHTL